MDATGGKFTTSRDYSRDVPRKPWTWTLGFGKAGCFKTCLCYITGKTYPILLCEAIVHSFILRLSETGLKFSAKTSLQHASRAATAEQSKSLRLPPLVSPYKTKLLTFFNDCKQVWPPQHVVVNACKMLHEFSPGGEFGVDQLLDNAELLQRLKTELAVWDLTVNVDDLRVFNFVCNKVKIFGIQWEPEESKACEIQHPLNPELALPDVLSEAISFMADNGFHSVAKCRVEFFKTWNKRACELECLETDLRRKMDSTLEKAVRGKRIALFEEMLDFYGCPDKGVVSELRDGASLTGEVEETGMLPFKFTPSLLTQGALDIHSGHGRRTVLLDPRGSGDLEVDQEVWRQTLEERDKGWLLGPIPESDVPDFAPISKKVWSQTKAQNTSHRRFQRVFSECSSICFRITSIAYCGRCMCSDFTLVCLRKNSWFGCKASCKNSRSCQCLQASWT